jgi:hypothetical protein
MSGVEDSPWADRLKRTRRNNPWADYESHDQKEWPVLDTAALYGLPGEVVRAIAPHTEAAQVALLAQYLVAAGNVIGRGPHYRVEGDNHGPNLFACLVGETSKGRKGTSWGRVRQIMSMADPRWMGDRVHSGLSSGEGLIWGVRDAITDYERQGRGAAAQRVEVEIDPGVRDKRLMIVESEFSAPLQVMKREGNILSRVIRDAWDRGDLATLTKNSPARATGAHVSIIGHITAAELRDDLDNISIANGFGNRFLWFMVRRSEPLPFGGALDEETVVDLGRRTREAIAVAQMVGRVALSAEAREDWRRLYPALSAGLPGMLGALTGRAEAQTIRLALIYALLDGRCEISREHLEAAVALWDYADESVDYIWGDALGDPIADEILRALREKGGKTRTELHHLFGRNRSAARISRALARLAAAGKVRAESRSDTGGRPAEVWVAVVEEA